MFDREGAAVVERERLDHRDRFLGQPPHSEQRGEHGLRQTQGCSWIKVIKLARQVIPGHPRLHGWMAFQIGSRPRPRKQVSMSAPDRPRGYARWRQDRALARL